MIDFAYEDLETEAVKEREANEKYEAACAAEEPFEPTPTKAQRVKKEAEFSLKCMGTDAGARYIDLEILRMITRLAEAIDER